jgi:hypothetical protein
VTYEIRARYDGSEYTPIDWADTEEEADQKVANYTEQFSIGWRLWWVEVEGKPPRVAPDKNVY